jgi:hypothetical protein
MNLTNVVSPFDIHYSKNKDILNIENNNIYLNEPQIFTKQAPRKQNTWLSRNRGTKGCKVMYSNGQNVFGKVCGDANHSNSDWVRGNVFSNKYPYKLHHKTKFLPKTKVIKNNPIIKKDSPFWPEPTTYKNINMYDHKSYPDLRNASRNEHGKPVFVYPYNPLNSSTFLHNTEGFSGNDLEMDLVKNVYYKYLIATVLIIVSLRILLKS